MDSLELWLIKMTMVNMTETGAGDETETEIGAGTVIETGTEARAATKTSTVTSIKR